MAAVTKDLSVDQGSTFAIVFEVKDSNNVTLDLSGYTAEMMVRKTHDTPALLTLSSTNGKLTINAPAGTVRVQLDPADTSAVVFKGDELEAVYDLEIASGGVVKRIAEGTFTLRREVTRL